MSIQISFKLKAETKTCYRFESRNQGAKNDFCTIYLKKDKITAAGIDPNEGLTVTIVEGSDDNDTGN